MFDIFASPCRYLQTSPGNKPKSKVRALIAKPSKKSERFRRVRHEKREIKPIREAVKVNFISFVLLRSRAEPLLLQTSYIIHGGAYRFLDERSHPLFFRTLCQKKRSRGCFRSPRNAFASGHLSLGVLFLEVFKND